MSELRDGGSEGPRLGAFAGVFVPTVLTILGAIMYLREGWTVGNAGLGGAVLIILLAHVITITTGLSVSSIATNIRVGAGGAFAIIAQSLGLEMGGCIGLPLYLAQTVSIVLYVLAFTEGWLRIFPGHPELWVAVVTFVSVVGISIVSTRFAARTQIVILAVVGLSLVSIGLGGAPEGQAHTPELWGSFEAASFWQTFAIFFPAVTGIMAGINLSGVLAKPRHAIPWGTLSGIAITLAIYLWLAWWLARSASPDELVANTTIMVDRAAFGWAVLAGLLGATFSSALGSIVAAPRVVQALAAHSLLPWSRFLAREHDGEPRQAILVTGAVAFVTLLAALAAGGLDAVAPLITMFFLLTYAILNAVVLVEQNLAMVSFRPTLSIPRAVPLVGMVSCLLVMFSVNAVFSLVSVMLAVAVYYWLQGRKLPMIHTGDVRSGLFLSVANWAAETATEVPAAPERTWQPNLLVPVTATDQLMGSYRILHALTMRKGAVHALGIYPPRSEQSVIGLQRLANDLRQDGIYARATLLEQEDVNVGTEAAMELLEATFFSPNLLFLQLGEDAGRFDMPRLASRATARRMGIVLLDRHPVIELGREKLVQVWIRDQSPEWKLGLRLSNLDLALLLAYQLARSWCGRISLCMAVSDEETARRGRRFLADLIELARLGGWAEAHVFTGRFEDAVAEAQHADLTVLGLPPEIRRERVEQLTAMIHGSCILVRDSGDESVLA
jgi:amino acid transporter